MIGCSAASALWLETSRHDQLRRFLSDHNLQITVRFTSKNDHKSNKHITEKKYQRPCLTVFFSDGIWWSNTLQELKSLDAEVLRAPKTSTCGEDTF